MKSRLLILLSFFLMTFVMQAQVTSVGLIGSGTAGGWGADTPMTQVTDSTWTLDVTLIAGEVKFRANGAWDVNWGAKDFPTGVGKQNGPNIPVFAGDYTVNFNSNSGAYAFHVKSDIGIIGSATPGGWGEDTNLYILDSVNYFTIMVLQAGEVKFRQDDDWAVNWGAADFPEGIGTQNGPNIPIATAGRYEIHFNKMTGAYKFDEVVDFTSIGVIGSATPGGWDTETKLIRQGNNPDLWKGLVTLVEGKLKFRANDAWTLNWGGGEFPQDTAVENGADIDVPASAGGDYQVTFNTKTLIYQFLKVIDYDRVGIIGSATPGGWDNDTPMQQDFDDVSIWRLRADLVDGEAKFRANNDWIVNWGGDGFPSGSAFQDGPNIQVPAGDYKITFNSTTGEYNFEAVIEYDRIAVVGKSGPFGAWPGDDDSRDAFLVKDPTNPNRWTLPSIVLTDFDPNDTGGSGIKFRAEAAWAVNWGAKEFPSGTGKQDGPNIECTAGTYKVEFRSDTGEYSFSEPSSTYDFLGSEVIKLFPNPAKDVLNIEINSDAMKGNVNFSLFDVKGQLVKSGVIDQDNSLKLNVSDLNPGNYMIRVSNAKNIVAKPVIITR